MFAVVYLVKAKIYIIIPQEWIKKLNQERLNNVGKQMYKLRRIFWSTEGVDCDGIPNTSIEPKFNLPKLCVFPPPNGITEACYSAHVKEYCCKCI